MNLLQQEDTVPWKLPVVAPARPTVHPIASTASNAEPDGRTSVIQPLHDLEDSDDHQVSEESGQSEVYQPCLTTLSRNSRIPAHDLVHGRDRNGRSDPQRSRQMEDAQNPRSVACQSFDPESTTSKINAEDISRALANELTRCFSNKNNNSNKFLPDDLESIIQTRVMTLLGQGGCRKRKAEQIDADDTNQSSAKRVACKTCSKVVGRPCDLK